MAASTTRHQSKKQKKEKREIPYLFTGRENGEFGTTELFFLPGVLRRASAVVRPAGVPGDRAAGLSVCGLWKEYRC